MLGNFNEEAQFILLKAKEEMIDLNHPYIGTEHLVLSILKNKTNLTKKLEEYGLTYQTFKEEIINIIGKGTKKTQFFLYTPLLKKVIENAMLDSKDNNNGEVTIEHLFSSLLEEGEGIAIRIFIGMDIDIDEMYDEFSSRLIKKTKKRKRKLLIDDLGTDLIEKAKNNKLDPVIDRDNEIKRLTEILCRRNKNNPLLIGEAGVGKTAIVEGLVKLIATSNVPVNLQNKRIISIDMASIVSGTKYRGEFEERMQKLIKEVIEEENIILFIDEIHTLVGAGGAEGAIDASNILKPYLARGELRCIGATTIDEYKKYIETDKALERRFQKINIKEPTASQTINILKEIAPLYESYHHVKIPDSIIENIVSLSNKYIYNRYQPDKSIDILDEVCASVSIKENKNQKEITKLKKELAKISKDKKSLILDNNLESAYIYRKKESTITSKINELELNYKKAITTITLKDIAKVIHQKTNIPIYEIENDNIKIIKQLEKNLKDNIIGQDNAIDSLIRITKKIKLGYNNNKVKSYLFVGPTGVGKTKLAKIYAKELTNDTNLIRLDMSEYSDTMSINKLLGSAPGYVGYQDNNTIFDKVRNNPNAVILLDEIDKAHPQIINLFYQILDEGTTTDSKGNIINFNNNIIIMTSNIGFEETKVGFNNTENINIITNLKKEFTPSFINRIDNIIIFNKLTNKDITTIIKNKLTKLQNKYPNFKYDNNIIREIIKESKYEEFGARQIDKIIENKIENNIIDKIIDNNEAINITTLTESLAL